MYYNCIKSNKIGFNYSQTIITKLLKIITQAN